MLKTPHRHKHDLGILDDLSKIKHLLASTAKEFKGKTAEVFHQGFENAKERTMDLREDTANKIAEKPFAAIGVALLSGLCLGYMLKKKRNSHRK